MSRSYKRVPYCGDHKGKTKKRVANHHIRRRLNRDPDLRIDHGGYKRHFCSYDICDYYSFCSWERYWRNELRNYEELRRMFPNSDRIEIPDKRKAYRRWLKWYRNK